MKKSILLGFLVLGGFTQVNAKNSVISHSSATRDPWSAFLSKLPEDSWLRKKCENDPCSSCNDIVLAIYLLSQKDPEKRKVAYDIFYNAQLDLFEDDETLRPEDIIEEVYQAEQALE